MFNTSCCYRANPAVGVWFHLERVILVGIVGNKAQDSPVLLLLPLIFALISLYLMYDAVVVVAVVVAVAVAVGIAVDIETVVAGIAVAVIVIVADAVAAVSGAVVVVAAAVAEAAES
jgi:hypothetical protein